MKMESVNYPEKFIKIDNKIFIVDINSIVKIDDIYTYYYYESSIKDRIDLFQYIEYNYDILLNIAIENYIKITLSPNQNEINKAKEEIKIIELLSDLGVI